MNIGILFPRSAAHPGVGISYIEGLKTFLKEEGIADQYNFISESVGFGGSEKEVYLLAEKLLVMEAVDVLVAYIDERVLEMLKPLLYATGKLLIVVNPGANYPINWVPQANIIQLNLQHAFLCWLTGGLAARGGNTNALAATTFYDCGYLHAAAMLKSFARYGGNIMFNDVNNGLYDDSFTISAVTGFLSADTATRKLLCIFDTKPAALLYKLLNKYEGADGLSLFVSPMMLEEKALVAPDVGNRFSIEGYLPWKADMETKANLEFVGIWHRKIKKEPDIFALLGWETGMILQQVLIRAEGRYADGGAIVDELKKLELDSPRGILKLDPKTQFYQAPVGKYSIAAGQGKREIVWIDNTAKEWEAFIQEPTEGAVSGWTNTYLCY